MDTTDLQAYIEKNIPLVRNAGFRITELSDKGVTVAGDFSKNYNHHKTVFGGSISVILILAAWAMVQEMMKSEDPEASIVISSQSIDYKSPVKTDFLGKCPAPDSQEINRFISQYKEKGYGNLSVSAFLHDKDSETIHASFNGIFYVKKNR